MNMVSVMSAVSRGLGLLRWNTTVWSSTTSIDVRVSRTGAYADSGFLKASKFALTSFAVKSLPLLNFTPWRSVIVQVLASSLCVAPNASAGTGWASGRRRTRP